MANETSRPTHRVRYHVEYDYEYWHAILPDRSQWQNQVHEGLPVFFRNPERSNFFSGTVTNRELFEDHARRRMCLQLTIDGHERSDNHVHARELPPMAFTPERIDTGEPEPPAESAPTHRAEVETYRRYVDGREINHGDTIAFRGSNGRGFRGVISEFGYEHGWGPPMATFTLIGCPVEARELSDRTILPAHVLRWEPLERPENSERLRSQSLSDLAERASFGIRNLGEVARSAGRSASEAAERQREFAREVQRMRERHAEDLIRNMGVPSILSTPRGDDRFYQTYANARLGEPWPESSLVEAGVTLREGGTGELIAPTDVQAGANFALRGGIIGRALNSARAGEEVAFRVLQNGPSVSLQRDAAQPTPPKKKRVLPRPGQFAERKILL